MPSRSRLRWTTDRVPALDELEAAHGVIESATGRSRRHAARQICHAYALLLVGARLTTLVGSTPWK